MTDSMPDDQLPAPDVPGLAMHAVVLDCAEIEPLERFWAAALGYVRWFEPFGQFAGLKPPPGDPRRGLALIFQRVPEAKVVKNRAHVDYEAVDRAAEVERLVGTGGDRSSARSTRIPACAGRSWPTRPATSSAWPGRERRPSDRPRWIAPDDPVRSGLRHLRPHRPVAPAVGSEPQVPGPGAPGRGPLRGAPLDPARSPGMPSPTSCTSWTRWDWRRRVATPSSRSSTPCPVAGCSGRGRPSRSSGASSASPTAGWPRTGRRSGDGSVSSWPATPRRPSTVSRARPGRGRSAPRRTARRPGPTGSG